MIYPSVARGRFLARPNRFIAHVELGGETLVCHVKNTGRCRELLVPGRTVWLAEGTNPGRKTKYDLIGVEKPTPGGALPVNMDAQAPNRVFGEWAAAGGLGFCPSAAGDPVRGLPVRLLLGGRPGPPGLLGDQGGDPGGGRGGPLPPTPPPCGG